MDNLNNPGSVLLASSINQGKIAAAAQGRRRIALFKIALPSPRGQSKPLSSIAHGALSPCDQQALAWSASSVLANPVIPGEKPICVVPTAASTVATALANPVIPGEKPVGVTPTATSTVATALANPVIPGVKPVGVVPTAASTVATAIANAA